MVALGTLLSAAALTFGGIAFVGGAVHREWIIASLGLVVAAMALSALLDAPITWNIDRQTLVLLAVMATAPILGGLLGWRYRSHS